MIKTFSEILTLYLKDGNRDNKPRSRKRDEQCADPLRQFFRGWKVANCSGKQIINGKKVADYREWRKSQGRATATIAREITVAANAINYCVQDMDWDLNNPFTKRHYSKADRKRMQPRNRVLSFEEEKLLLQHSTGLLRDLIVFYLETGMRANEALNLTCDRVDGDLAVMGIDDHKGGYVDARFLTEKAREILSRQPKNKYAFSLKGEKVSYNWLRNQWLSLRKRTGIKDIRVHDLRRTCGDRIRKLYGLEAAQSILGHRDMGTTERNYAPVSADIIRRALLLNTGGRDLSQDTDNKEDFSDLSAYAMRVH